MNRIALPTEQFPLRLGDRGRLVLPSAVRKRLALKQGDRLVLTVTEDGTIQLTTAREAARDARGMLRTMIPTVARRSLSSELIQERREEAKHE